MEMEYCASGDLSHCLWPNKGTNYVEKVIKTLSVQLLLGLKTLHQNGIIHCNLKPNLPPILGQISTPHALESPGFWSGFYPPCNGMSR